MAQHVRKAEVLDAGAGIVGRSLTPTTLSNYTTNEGSTMGHIFVWTLKDVVGLILLGLIAGFWALLWALTAYCNWRSARRKRAAKATGATP